MIEWFIKLFPEHSDLWLIVCGCYGLMITDIFLLLLWEKSK
jgi:hypothetical protein